MVCRRSNGCTSHKESLSTAASRQSNAITAEFTEPIPICFNAFQSHALRSYGDKQVLLDKDYSLKPKDVLLGPKGARDICHAGNERLRILAEMHRHRYHQATTKKGKTTIIKAIVQIVRGTGGGFVRYSNGVWYDVGDIKARDKVGHILRRLPSTSNQDPRLLSTRHQDPDRHRKLPVSFDGRKPVATTDASKPEKDNPSFNLLVAVANRETERRREIIPPDSTAEPGLKSLRDFQMLDVRGDTTHPSAVRIPCQVKAPPEPILTTDKVGAHEARSSMPELRDFLCKTLLVGCLLDPADASHA